MRHCRLCLSLCCLIGCTSEPASPQTASNRKDASPPSQPPDSSVDGADAALPAKPLRILVYSRTVTFRHDTIESGRDAIAEIARRHDGTLESTEDPLQLAAALARVDVVVFLMTTGDVLEDAQQTQLEAFVRNGGGFVGVHSAADTEYDWPFYETLNGAWFADHPAIQPATLVRESADHPAVSFLPATWQRTDEWYNFRTNPRGKVQVLLRLDETSYSGGTMGGDHPIVWAHTIDRGRALYTALGHTQESWREPLFLQHIEAALLWAADVHPPP
jgi:type 1 glutamine amidotransferase